MIRYASLEDTEILIELFNTVFGDDGEQLARDYLKCCFSNDYRKPHFIVKEVDNTIIGAAAYSQELFTTDTWGISWVAVNPAFENKGYGTELVYFCEKEIQKNIETYAFVILGTFPNKTGLYEKNEFQKIFSDNDHGSLMIKKIMKE